MAGMKSGVRLYENSNIVGSVAGRVHPKAEEMAWDDLKRAIARDLFDVLDDGGLWTIRITRDREELPRPWEPARPLNLRLTIRAEVARLSGS